MASAEERKLATPVSGPKFKAFLSYAHADMKWAKWLHKRLESYAIDRDMVGRETPLGQVPRSLYPIFRDRDDFVSGGSLADVTISALDDSKALVVLCSPIAAKRPAVNEEIRLFRLRHPLRPIIPVFIEGEFPENMPDALRYDPNESNSVGSSAATILGVDLRERADGTRVGLAKIVAGLTGVATDDFVKRAERRRNIELRRWIASLAALSAVLIGLVAWSEVNRQTAAFERDRAQRSFRAANSAAKGLASKIASELANVAGIRSETVDSILDRVKQVVDELGKQAPDDPDLMLTRSDMLFEIGRIKKRQGDTAGAISTFESALSIQEQMLKRIPGWATWVGGYGLANMELGDLKIETQDFEGALKSYNKALEASRDTARRGWRIPPEQLIVLRAEPADMLVRVAHAKLLVGDLQGARSDYLEAIELLEAALLQFPDNKYVIRSLVDALRSFARDMIKDEWLGKKQDNWRRAEELLLRAVSLQSVFLSADPDSRYEIVGVADAYGQLARLKRMLRDEAGALSAATEVINAYRKLVLGDKSDFHAATHLGESLLEYVRILAAFKRTEDSIVAGREAVEYIRSLHLGGGQKDPFVTSLLADALDILAAISIRDVTSAISMYKESARLRNAILIEAPGDTEIRKRMAFSLKMIGLLHRDLGQEREYLAAMEESYLADPNDIDVLNDIAWLLATIKHGELRDGRRAVQLAEEANRRSGGSQAATIDTLAAAYARDGRFEEAVALQKKAMALEPQLAKDADALARLRQYRNHLPWPD